MRRFLISIVILVKAFFANGQNSDDASKMNEVRLALEKYNDCQLANELLDQLNLSAKNDPLFYFYKYKAFSNGGWPLSAYLDSTIYFLNKYLEYFPTDINLRKESVELSLKLKQIQSRYRDERYYRNNNRNNSTGLDCISRVNCSDSLKLETRNGRIEQIKFTYQPVLIKPRLVGEEVSSSNRKSVYHYIDYKIQQGDIQKLPINIYFTLRVTSPIMYSWDRISVRGKLFVDSISNQKIDLLQETGVSTWKNSKWNRDGWAVKTLTGASDFRLELSKQSIWEFTNKVMEMNELWVEFYDNIVEYVPGFKSDGKVIYPNGHRTEDKGVLIFKNYSDDFRKKNGYFSIALDIGGNINGILDDKVFLTLKFIEEYFAIEFITDKR